MKTIKIKSISISIIAVLSLLFSSQGASAKGKAIERYLEIFGKVKTENTDLANAVITVYDEKDNSLAGHYKSDAEGKFNIKLDMNKVYFVHFSKSGMMTKVVKINTVIPVTPFMSYQYEYKFNINLVQSSDAEAFKAPIAEIYYDIKQDGFDYNREYDREMRVENKKPAIQGKPLGIASIVR